MVFDVGGSNPSSPTMVFLFCLVFAIGVWVALWASDENRDAILILGISVASATLFAAQLYYK